MPARILLNVAIALGLLVAPPVATHAAEPLTRSPWQEVTLSVSDLERTAAFFEQVAGYERRWRGPLGAAAIAAWGLDAGAGAEALVLGQPGHATPVVRLIQFSDAGDAVPMRPGARAWDTGCHFSVMVRAKNLDRLYDEAIRLGWWTETPIADLVFGRSRLKIVIFKGPDGVQVQAYERLSPPLPEAIGPFERMTRPFNLMQMVSDRDASYAWATKVLGFDTFYNGKPFTAKTPTPMPLGIPVNLTTSARYRAGIVYPVAGEFGRLEMIEMMDLDGFDYRERCRAPNLGILSVRYPVDDVEATREAILARGGEVSGEIASFELPPFGPVRQLTTAAPDGALVQWIEAVDP